MFIKTRPNWIAEGLWHRLMHQMEYRTYLRRQAIRFFKSPRLAGAYASYREAVRSADWSLVDERVSEVTELAIAADDRRTIADMVKALDQLGRYRESAGLWLDRLAETSRTEANEWRGEALAGKTVLVNLNSTHRQGLGTGYRCASLLPHIAREAGRTIALVEPRLVPTFRRSLPQIEFVTSNTELDGSIDFVILPTFLIAWFAAKEASRQPQFHALIPDRSKVEELRAKYLAGDQSTRRAPLIGICWRSSHHGKDLPALPYWRRFIERTEARFVSLQYGDVTSDLAAIGGGRVMVDDSIDQLRDMDAFAAQVAALDGVITIVSTLAHVGGALNIPTVVLRDDWFRREWPVTSDQVPWYPKVRIAGKDRRDWGAVFDDALSKLQQLVAEPLPYSA